MRSMQFRIFALMIIAAAQPAIAMAQQTYQQVADIKIGGPLPAQWDYALADGPSKRLYVSHNAEVVVIDTATDKIIGRIADTPGVHGIAVGAGKVFTSNGRENKISVVDPKTLATLSKIDSGGANPDAITYDPTKNEVWVFNHTGMSATQIDAASGKVIATIALTGTAESGQADGAGKVFVNVEDKDQIDVIDIAAKKVTASWPVAPGTSPTGLSLDRASHRLWVGAGKFMVMMDAQSGKVVSNVPICGGTDATWYDPGTKLAFSSCRDGHITVARVTGDAMTVVQTIDTAPGSRTMALDVATHKLYLAAAKPNASGGRGNDPESFHVLVYALK
jgi:DNA-binding beta-propeller fold protein YncE